MNFTATDILLRDTPTGVTVWVSQRVVVGMCGVSEEYTWKLRLRYKSSLRASWQQPAEGSDFFLGAVPGKAWRWGRKNGQYYYDVDTIPDRRPACYRSALPAKEELITMVEGAGLRESRARESGVRRAIIAQVEQYLCNEDVRYYTAYRIGDMCIYNATKAREMARSAAWVTYLRSADPQAVGVASRGELMDIAAAMLAEAKIEGLKVATAESLRRKVAYSPTDHAKLLEYLVSGHYCNDNRRIVGKCPVVDMTTGEILKYDYHEAVMMTYWLNPGDSAKDTKRDTWALYASDMEALGVEPIAPSTFNKYLRTWRNSMLSAKERHGSKYYDSAYRPYVPAKPLEYANSLWASDGSGVVPYKVLNSRGQWTVRKVYVMMISDVASRFIAGWAASKEKEHAETGEMLRIAMRMALKRNGRTEVMDFVSDNHGAYTSRDSEDFLRDVCRNYRTIQAGNSKANPAELMFRLFKRKNKRYFRLAETSWDAKGLDSVANPDYYKIEELPTYEEAITKLQRAIDQWNTTPMSNDMTPEAWFDTLKNSSAGQYDDRLYRRITGYRSRQDIGPKRAIMTCRHAGDTLQFEIPTDGDTVALIAKHMGLTAGVEVEVCWDDLGADVYTLGGRYMFNCTRAQLSSKSISEASDASMAAMGHNLARGNRMDEMVDTYTREIASARDTYVGRYEFNAHSGTGTKEDYNEMREREQEERLAAAAGSVDRKAKIRQEKKAAAEIKAQKAKEKAEALAYQKSRIQNFERFL